MPTSNEPARSLLRQALAHHRSGHLDEAVALYRRCLDRAPEEAAIWANLGIALQRHGA